MDKIDKANQLIQQALADKKLTLNEIQTLIGHLNSACRVVDPGRAFFRRLWCHVGT